MKINILPVDFEPKKQQSRNLIIVFVFSCFLLPALFSCADKTRQHPDPVELTWNFNPGHEGWSGDFAEYPVGGETQYELLFEHDTLPLPLDQEQHSLKLSGNNINGDLFMFVKKRITGLDPSTVYFVTFTVEFASDLPGDSTLHDSPGNLIHMAAGATSAEPQKVNGENNVYAMNIDKCDLGQDGENMIVLGNFINGTNQPVYTLNSLNNETPFRCVTSDKGELWIIIGIDSAYPALTTAYINSVKVELF